MFESDPFLQLIFGVGVIYSLDFFIRFLKWGFQVSNSKRLSIATKKLRIIGWFSVFLAAVGLYFTWFWIFFGISFLSHFSIGLLVVFLICIGVLFKAYFYSTTPVMTALWLRRFHIEPSSNFRLSRVFEKLSISNVRVMTLADTIIASSSLSGRQVYLKLGLDFVVIIILPVVMLVAAFAITINVLLNAELIRHNVEIADWIFTEDAIYAAVTFVVLMLILGVYRFFRNVKKVQVLGTGVQELDSEAIKSFMKDISHQVKSLSGYDYYSGKRVLRVSDQNWQEAVSHAIETVDLVFFDATEYSEPMAWELNQILSNNHMPYLVLMTESQDIDPKFKKILTLFGTSNEPTVLSYGEYQHQGKKGERNFKKLLIEAVNIQQNKQRLNSPAYAS